MTDLTKEDLERRLFVITTKSLAQKQVLGFQLQKENLSNLAKTLELVEQLLAEKTTPQILKDSFYEFQTELKNAILHKLGANT